MKNEMGYIEKEVTARLEIRIPKGLKEAYDSRCKDDCTNMSDNIRKHIHEYLSPTTVAVEPHNNPFKEEPSYIEFAKIMNESVFSPEPMDGPTFRDKVIEGRIKDYDRKMEEAMFPEVPQQWVSKLDSEGVTVKDTKDLRVDEIVEQLEALLVEVKKLR